MTGGEMSGQVSSGAAVGHAERYTRVAILLHWAIAAFILFNLAFGFFMEEYEPPLKFIIIVAHISAGMTVLGLTVLRIVWRLTHRPPPLSPTLSGWERRLAHAVHIGIYVLMLALPLTGWAMISANPPQNSPVAQAQARQYEAAKAAGIDAPPPRVSGHARFWWVTPLPSITPISEMGRYPEGVERQYVLHEQMVDAHEIGGWAMIVLLLLHVAGALKHQILDREDQFARMGVGRFRRTNSAAPPI
jgi:cytochrome b561